METAEFKCKIIIDKDGFRIVINDEIQEKLFGCVDDAIFALDDALIEHYELCRNKIQDEFIILSGGTVEYFKEEDFDDEDNYGMPEDIYCMECGEDKNLIYLCSYANGDEYRCENCKEKFVW